MSATKYVNAVASQAQLRYTNINENIISLNSTISVVALIFTVMIMRSLM